MSNLESVEKRVGYSFLDKRLLEQSLTHLSYANEMGVESYERLEFLGDAVVELVVSDYIYRNLNFDVGVSTRLRASLVSTDSLSKISQDLELDKIAKKSRSLSQLSKKNIADLFESLIGAIYIDGGVDEARKVIEKLVIKDMENIRFVIRNSIDYKSRFQEYMQKQSQHFEYKVISSEGLDHIKTHTIGLWINEEKIVEFTASSKQIAEEKCAEYYLKNFTDIVSDIN